MDVGAGAGRGLLALRDLESLPAGFSIATQCQVLDHCAVLRVWLLGAFLRRTRPPLVQSPGRLAVRDVD